ncbi:MAG TPA: nucleotidyltransferase family protein [Candidatus Acidoferrales bacterium]|nr:nucleotidyltransferase family protein [Candidatus Acidoferrales bacterium]
MIVAVILSAGESSRMGSPKALLRVDGQTFIERIIGTLRQTAVDKTLVVLGRHADEIRAAIACLPVDIVVNEDYKKGQLSSLQAAIRSLAGAPVEAIIVHLVDHPFVKPEIVGEMVRRFRESGKLIVVPTHRGRRGHPVLFSSRLFPELLAAPLDLGAKPVVRAHRADMLEIETADAGVLIDIDTPEEYRRHVGGIDGEG